MNGIGTSGMYVSYALKSSLGIWFKNGPERVAFKKSGKV